MTEPTQPLTLDNYKDLVWDKLIDVYLDKLLGKVWGPIADIVSLVMRKLFDHFYQVFKEHLIARKIGIMNAAHEAFFNRADLELTVLARDLSTDPIEFQRVRDARKKAMSEFTRLAS